MEMNSMNALLLLLMMMMMMMMYVSSARSIADMGQADPKSLFPGQQHH